MPLYDDIADAFELLPGGADVGLTNIGATEETNENTYAAGNAGVWVKVDLSQYIQDTNVDIELSASNVTGAGFHPYMDTMKVNDVSFDPNSPDFSKLSFVSGTFLGDGTSSPPPITKTLKGGTGTGSNASITGIFYFYFTDYDYDGTEGSSTIAYTVPAAPICIDAIDVINPDNPDASISGSYVHEGNARTPEGFSSVEQAPGTLKWTWEGPTGLYEIYVTGKAPSTPNDGRMRVLVKINGKSLTGIAENSPNIADTNDHSWNQYFWESHDYSDTGWNFNTDGVQFPYAILNTGDIVEITLLSYLRAPTTFDYIGGDLKTVCFTPVEDATDYCTGVFDFPENPLGDAWGSEKGWGGQKLIPDEVFTETGITPYDEGNFAWGVNFTDNDMCALDDGTVYVIFKDGFTGGGTGPGGSNYKSWIALKKYDPGSDSWSQIATLNINDPDDKYEAGAVSIVLGNDNMIYASWWEVTTYTAGTPATYQNDWHMIKLDPSDDSYTELGTGQHAATVGTGTDEIYDNVNINTGTLANGIAASSNGDVFVTSIEEVWFGAHPGGQTERRLFVWRWNGSSWSNLNVPDPSILNGSDPDNWTVGFENGFWDLLCPIIAARPNDGIVTDGFTIYYPYTYFETYTRWRGITITYTIGSGWGAEINTDWNSILGGLWWTDTGLTNVSTLDESLLWSEKLNKLVLVCDFLAGPGPWGALQMNDSFTQWEPIESEINGMVSMNWNQSRNNASIGSDGNIYRAMMADIGIGSNGWFEPKIAKHAPGYGPQYTNGARKSLGETAEWWGTMYATQNVPFQIVGNYAYVLYNLYTEPLSWEAGVDERSADGFFVFKLPFVPCAGAVHLSRVKFRPFQDQNF